MLGPQDHVCPRCKQRQYKNYCRSCDAFFYECGCRVEPDPPWGVLQTGPSAMSDVLDGQPYSYADVSRAINALAVERGDLSGVPMPLPGLRITLESRHP